jgi:hypothetical protein
MEKSKIRHMFPGGNTSKGFFSYYDYVLPQEKAKRIFILKGGPGVGKSTFMRKIAEGMCNKGFVVEYMHCSSDPDSLDGIVFPDIKIAMLDGTAPHIVDPKNPGAVDEIINLGQFWNEDKIYENRDEILQINKEIGRCFARAYRYLQAAYSVYSDNEAIYSLAMNHGKANVLIDKTIKRIFKGIDVSEINGKKRHLFASAITPKGVVNYLPSLLATDELIAVTGKPGTGTERLIERVRQCAVERGLYTESYYCALNPYKLEHLVIPELNVSITTRNPNHYTDQQPTMEISFDELLNNSTVENHQQEIRFNQELFEKLLDKAVQTIKNAKKLHDTLESYYIPTMNFSDVQKCQEAILEKLGVIVQGYRSGCEQ